MSSFYCLCCAQVLMLADTQTELAKVRHLFCRACRMLSAVWACHASELAPHMLSSVAGGKVALPGEFWHSRGVSARCRAWDWSWMQRACWATRGPRGVPISPHCCHYAVCKAVDIICSRTCHMKQAGVQSVLLEKVRCSESGWSVAGTVQSSMTTPSLT